MRREKITVLPFHWFWLFVVLADVAHEFSFEIRQGREHAAGDDIAFDPGEPQLHLIDLAPEKRIPC
jgi:hypothetical protein